MITYADNRLKDEVRNIWQISFPTIRTILSISISAKNIKTKTH